MSDLQPGPELDARVMRWLRPGGARMTRTKAQLLANARTVTRQVRARGRTPPTAMNKLEAAYAVELEILKRSGEIMDWRFEALKLRLGERCWYTPDFLVLLHDGQVELHEVKGFWRDDARVKIQAAASQYPCLLFRSVERPRGRHGVAWDVREIGCR